ncbi:MAG TPA: SCP2 sterol-binding domain-containing protein [Woeseiaceae bacterium]|nr:SCP2 sterol-binding domain-containing protein [Woeseiaceae bacterium]
MLEDLTARVLRLVDGEDAFGFDIRIVVADLGCIFIDGNREPIEVSNEDRAADTVLRVNASDMLALLDRRLAPLNAFMLGKLSVDGDLSKAMQLTALFR